MARRRAVTKTEVLVGAVVLGLVGAFVLPAWRESRVQNARAACLANLGEIGRAIGAYLEDSGDHWPYVAKLSSHKLPDQNWPTLPVVLAPYLRDRSDVFRCPADARRLSKEDEPELYEKFGSRTTWFETEGLSYEWYWGKVYGGNKIGQESMTSAKGFGYGRADQTLLADFEPFHRGDGGGEINTLFADLVARTSRPTADE